jgi:transposase InsO family protein
MDLDSSTTAPSVCRGCEVGKSTRKPFSVSSTKRTSAILEVVHSDLAGPMQTKSLQGSYYTATFIDDHSKLAVVYFIASKDQFAKVFNMYLSWAETQTTLKLKALHSDCGGEYMAKAVQDTLKQRGIEHHLTMPGSPQSNGKAERFNRTITDKAMAMLHTAGLSFGFWEYAMNAAVHIYNRSPTRTLKWRTPFEVWYSGKVPDVSHLRIFGCKGYMHVPADKRRKLDAKAIEVTLVGFEPGAKGYQLWDKQTHSVRLSRDVTFDESSFPSQKGVETHPAPIPPVPVIAAPNLAARPPFHIDYPVRAPSPTQSQSSAEDVEDLLDPRPSTPPSVKPIPPPNTPRTPKWDRPAPTSPPPRPSATHIKHEPVSPGQDMPGSFSDRIQRSEMLREMDNAPRRSTRVPVPNPRYYNTDNVAVRGRRLGYAELLAVAYVGRDPASYSEAMRSADADQWSEACQYEIDALAKNGTWELVDLPPGRKAVKSKWVFKLKADGRYRARLVAKGFTQIPGVDFDETFSPVARFESLRMLLALATLEDWHIHQMDVKSVFLNGVLDEEIFMEQPQGFITTGSETQVCHLRKAIYGLKQASRQWNLQFHGVLTGLGFKQTYADAGIYVCHQQEGDGPLFIILYVDDITILGASLQAVQRLKSDLSACYEMSDLGEIESYLGICITHDRSHKRLEIDQSGYLSDVLERFGMADASPHNTPLPTGADEHLKKFDGLATASDIKHYQSLIGSLLYLQIGMRPDISFAVSRLAQYAANPSPQHLRLAQYVLSYLVGTVDTHPCL